MVRPGWAGAVDDVGHARAASARLSGGLDPITLSVLASALAGIAEEMGAVLIRGAYSSNIKERRDCSAALFDAEGRMVAQAEHIPVHLGAMPEAVAAVIARATRARRRLRPQRPVHRRHAPARHHARVAGGRSSGDVLGYAVTRAHHSDVGGMRPGLDAGGLARDLAGGPRHPAGAARCARARTARDVLDLLLANVRTPDVRRGDLRAQIAANRLAERAPAPSSSSAAGATSSTPAFDEVLAYAERRTREALARAARRRATRRRGELEGDGVTDDDIPDRVARRRSPATR